MPSPNKSQHADGSAERVNSSPLSLGRVLARLACFSLAFALLSSAELKSAYGAEPAPLVFFADKDYPPVAYLEEGVAKGMDIDLAKALAGVMKREIRIEMMDWSRAQQGVLRGEADALLGMSISEERRALFDFADPTFTREFVLVVRSGGMTIHDVSDLKAKRVGVTSGGFPRTFLNGQPGIDMVTVDNYRDGLERLSAGTLDAMAADRWVAAYLIEKSGLRGVTIVNKPFATAPCAIAVRKGNSVLVGEINRALQTLKARGRITEIQDSWRPQEIMFISRERVRNAIAAVAGFFLVISLGTMAIWIFTLRRRARERMQTEEELRWRTAFFEATVRSAIDGILVVDSQDRKILQNQRMVDLWKIPPDIAADPDDAKQGRFILDRVKYPAAFAEKVASLYAHPDETSVDEIELIDGTILDRYSAPVRGSDGKHYGRVWTFHDITERKRAEAALREKQGQLILAMEISKLGQWELDVAGNLITADDHVLRMLGTSLAQEGGGSMSPEDYIRRFVHPSDAALVADELNMGIAAADRSFARQFEHRIIRADGAEGVMMTRSKVVMDTAGRTVKICGTNQDITEQKRAEAALMQSEERFSRMLRISPIPIVLTRLADGSLLDANDSFLQMAGFTREEVIGRTTLDLNVYPDPERRAYIWKQLREHGHLHAHEQLFRTKSGEIRNHILWFEVISIGGEECSLVFALDLTDRKKLEEQFLRAQRVESIGTLAGGIAHDLNNVLGPIILSLELLKLKFADPDSEELISMIETGARRGAAMVSQVLSFARGVHGQRVELQIKHVIRDIQKIANDTFLKHILVRTIIPYDLWTIRGDPTQLHQVLLNLCVNARDAMPGGGTLTISAKNLTIGADYAGAPLDAKPGPYVLLQVEDSGAGIPAEIIAQIFDPFFTTKEVGKGTGLGLATTLGIVKSHRGFILVQSELGQGTTFKVHFPAQTEGAAESVAPIAAELPRGNGEIILVVDDEAAVRVISKQTLEAFGYRVILASDGVEAVREFAQRGEEIAAVFTDITMPAMGGLAMIEALRALNPQLPIVATSGLPTDDARTGLTRLGVGCFLPKPFTAERLLKALRQAMTGIE